MAFQLGTNGKKLLIPLLVMIFLAGGFAIWTKIPNNWKHAIVPGGSGSPSTASSSGDKSVMNVCVVTWGGYVGGQYFNGGFNPSAESRYLKNYNLKVKFTIMDDFLASREAWKSGNCDLLWATVDAFTTEAANFQKAGLNPKFVFQADWSRGGDAIVVGPGINSMKDLKGKTVAVAYGTPSHTFLQRMLESSGMSISDIKLKDTGDAIKAGDAFKSHSVDAAVVWSPDDVASVRAIPGSKVLVSTKQASQIIADGFFAKSEYIDAHREDIKHLIEGWMIGAAEINSDPAAKQAAARILANAFNMSESDALGSINNVRLATLGDNKAFFGLDDSYTGITGEQLFRESGLLYRKNGYTDLVPSIPEWRTITDISLLRDINLEGPQNAAEGGPRFSAPDASLATAQAFSSKSLSVQFVTGSATLTEDAKASILRDFIPTARSFRDARIRIEGNTDSTGSKSGNVSLSRHRAQAVADFLADYGFDRNRFVVRGNGSSKPTCFMQTPECLSQNRNTTFELLK
jgi:NitT/TauT family transport system substrate-binding protein